MDTVSVNPNRPSGALSNDQSIDTDETDHPDYHDDDNSVPSLAPRYNYDDDSSSDDESYAGAAAARRYNSEGSSNRNNIEDEEKGTSHIHQRFIASYNDESSDDSSEESYDVPSLIPRQNHDDESINEDSDTEEGSIEWSEAPTTSSRENKSDRFIEDGESDDGSSESSDMPKLVLREHRDGEYQSDDSDSDDESSAYSEINFVPSAIREATTTKYDGELDDKTNPTLRAETECRRRQQTKSRDANNNQRRAEGTTYDSKDSNAIKRTNDGTKSNTNLERTDKADESTATKEHQTKEYLKRKERETRNATIPTSISIFRQNNDEEAGIETESHEVVQAETIQIDINEKDAKRKVVPRFDIRRELEDDEALPKGGTMGSKPQGITRISGINKGGMQLNNVRSTIQHAMDLDIDIQCFSENNLDTLKGHVQQKMFEDVRALDKDAKATWGSGNIPTESVFKPGGTGIVTFGKTGGRVKEQGADDLGRWTYQLLDGKGDKDILIVSVYQCCKNPTNTMGITAYHQQRLMLSELDRQDMDPRRNFLKDLKAFLHEMLDDETRTVMPIILGDWNEECKGTSNSQKLCDEFGLVDVWDRLYPDEPQFKTYIRGSRRIDFALALPATADCVTNIVYEPFHYRLSGDHRGFYLDIDEKRLFGNDMPDTFDLMGRGFTTKDRTAVKTYLEAFYSHLTENNVFKRIGTLLENEHEDHELAEAIDRELTRACKHAENKCRKKRLDYWSIELHEVKRAVSVWCQFRRRKKKHLSSVALLTQAQACGIEIDPEITDTAIDDKISKLKKDVIAIHKNSAERRTQCQLEQANIAEDASDKEKANAIRQIAQSERKSRAFKSLKFQRGQHQKAMTINRLQVPKSWPTLDEYDETKDYVLEDPKSVKEEDEWREVNCPREIEYFLCLRNQRHFGQSETEGTPFTTPEMKKKFNWNASTHEAELVLEGNYEDDELSDIARLFLDNMTRVTDLEGLPPMVTKEDLRGKFKKWRESTSTSPSGRHLGHYKILFQTIDKSLEDGERTKLRGMQDDIATSYTMMINYAIKHRYSYERWKHIVNMMLYKEEGNVKIHRLRVIHLYEADLNFLLGLKWKDAIHKSQRDQTLNSGQYGGCPGKDPTTVTLLEEARLDYSTLTRTPFTNFDNDASSCYDRILVSIASLVGRSFGINKDVIFVHAKTLEEAEFKLKISNKVTEASYKHCVKFPIHGTGQGSGNSPMIWCFISSKLFDCHNKNAYGMLFKSPNGEMIIRMSIIGFVDDSTCTTGGDPEKPIEDLIGKMKHDAQLWNDLLWCSGGKLELPKCGYHVIYYDFHDNGIPYLRHSYDQPVAITDANEKEIPIKAKTIFEPRKNLGHYKAPAGNCNTQYEAIKTKAIKLSNAIIRTGATRDEARMLYEAVYRPSIEYAIPQSFLTTKQLRNIEKSSIPKILAKCGYNRKTATAIMNGPKELGGGGFLPLTVVAGVGYVLHFLKHWRSPEEDASKIVRIVMAWTQYQAGVSYPILEYPEKELPYVQGRYIPAVRKYLNEVDATVELEQTYVQQKLRVNDVNIMEYAMKNLKLTDVQLTRLNCVRMYLGFTYVSEICTVDGRKVAKGVLRREKDGDEYVTTLTRPHQKKPNSASWKFWEKLITALTEADNKTLRTRLGRWTEYHSSAGEWESYIDQHGIVRSRAMTGKWKEYKKIGTQLRLEKEDIQYKPTKEDRPIRILTLSNNKKYCEMTATIKKPAKEVKKFGPKSPWEKLVQSQPAWVRTLVESITYESLEEIVDMIKIYGYLIAVSDGSVKDFAMTFGWAISTPNGIRIASAAGPCSGRQNSLRSEAAGMLSVTLFFALLTTYYEMESVDVTFVSDNLELINRSRNHLEYINPYPNTTLTSEYDLTEQIYLTHKAYNINAKFEHVKGHQDDKLEYHELPLKAQLNIDADHLAGLFQRDHGKYLPKVQLIPSCPAVLHIRGVTITSNFRHQLQRAYVEPRYVFHLQNKFGWSNATAEIIAWKSLSIGIRRIRREVLTTKVCNDLMPTAASLKKRKYQFNDQCCLCGREETRDHMIRCTDETRLKWRRKYIGLIRQRMEHLETDYGLKEMFCNAVTDWFQDERVDIDKYPVKYHLALITQNNIGWRQIFMGRISQEWEKLQGSGPTINGKNREAYIWGASLVEVSIKSFMELWEQRNEEVHGKTEQQKQKKRLEKLSIEVRRLHSMRDLTRPSDDFIFHKDVEIFLEKATAKMAANYISTNKRIIKHSIAAATKQAITHTKNILHWLKPIRAGGKERIQKWKRDKLVHDAFSKKKRRKDAPVESRLMQSLLGYITLQQDLS